MIDDKRFFFQNWLSDAAIDSMHMADTEAYFLGAAGSAATSRSTAICGLL